jgi:hypothetical protein
LTHARFQIHAARREDGDEQPAQNGKPVRLPAIIEAEALDAHLAQRIVVALEQGLLGLPSVVRGKAIADQVGDIVERASPAGNLPIDRGHAFIAKRTPEQQIVCTIVTVQETSGDWTTTD